VHKELALLRKIQAFDLDIQAITSRAQRLRESLDELYAAHESLKEALDGQKQQLDDTRKLMRDKHMELEANDDRYKSSKAKLNAVSNTREYNALEKEIDALKKQRAQLEEEHESLREAVEGAEADVTEKEGRTRALDEQIRAEEAGISGESTSAENRIKSVQSSRDKLKTDVPKPLVRRYEFIATRRAGAAVVAARDGVCTGCNMMLPPQLYNEVQVGQKIIQCPSCQRLLYYENDAERTAAGG
jgi:predicted  nucleic acid-binding Zn-ribbon protein